MAVRHRALALARGRTDPAKALSDRARYDALYTDLKNERSHYWQHWRELAEFIRPRRAKFTLTDKNKGDRRNQNIIDSTCLFASQTLASGLHAGLTSPARPWMKSATPDPALNKFKPVQAWLEEVTMRMLAVFAQSNLYTALPTLYGDLGDFGSAAMSCLPDTEDLVRFRVYPVGTYVAGLDARGLAATFIYETSYSVLQLIEEFGFDNAASTEINWSRFSAAVKKLWDDGKYAQQVDVTWVVTPNVDYRAGSPFSKDLRFKSCYYETKSNGAQILREGGYNTFPVFFTRWDVTDGDTYGTDCPGMTALGDVKQLQIEHREKGKAIQKKVTPPMTAEASLRNQKTSVLPGDITFTRDPKDGFKPSYQIEFDIRELREDIAEVQYRIQRAYKEDLFLMLARSDDRLGADRPTATEIVERKEEKMLALGPMLERTNDETLTPLYDRVFAMMDEAGLIPEPPDELDGVKVKPVYTSVLAQAQKLVGVAAQDRLITTVIGMADVFPEAVNKLDAKRAVDNYGDMLGGDPLLVRTNEQADAITQAQQQAQQQAMAAQNAAQLGKGLKDASQAKLDENSVLDSLVQIGQS